MNQVEKRLETAAKLVFFLPLLIVILEGLAIRLKVIPPSEPFSFQIYKIVWILTLFITPLLGILILLFTLWIWRNTTRSKLSHPLKSSLILSLIHI